MLGEYAQLYPHFFCNSRNRHEKLFANKHVIHLFGLTHHTHPSFHGQSGLREPSCFLLRCLVGQDSQRSSQIANAARAKAPRGPKVPRERSKALGKMEGLGSMRTNENNIYYSVSSKMASWELLKGFSGKTI